MDATDFEPPKFISDVIKDGYIVYEKISQGAFGAVYRAENTQKVPCAIKIYFNHSEPRVVLNELLFSYYLGDHDEFPKFIEAYEKRGVHVLIIEYFEGISIRELRNKDQKFLLEYCLEFAKCLDKLHQLGVIHNDIKPSNFLFNQKLRKGKLIDFGLCSVVCYYVTF